MKTTQTLEPSRSRNKVLSCALGDESFLTGMWVGVEAACCFGSRSGPSHRDPPFDPKLGILYYLPESIPTN